MITLDRGKIIFHLDDERWEIIMKEMVIGEEYDNGDGRLDVEYDYEGPRELTKEEADILAEDVEKLIKLIIIGLEEMAEMGVENE